MVSSPPEPTSQIEDQVNAIGSQTENPDDVIGLQTQRPMESDFVVDDRWKLSKLKSARNAHSVARSALEAERHAEANWIPQKAKTINFTIESSFQYRWECEILIRSDNAARSIHNGINILKIVKRSSISL